MERLKSLLLPIRRSLKTQIIMLTVAALVCVELAIVTWSLASYRYERLERHMAQDMLVADALTILRPESTAEKLVAGIQAQTLLGRARSGGIVVRRGEELWRVGRVFAASEVDLVFDMDEVPPLFSRIDDMLSLVLFGGGRRMVLAQHSPINPDELVELYTTDDALRAETMAHAWDMLLVCLVVTLFLGTILVVALDRLIVLPLAAAAGSIRRFHADPENETADPPPTDRPDEIGELERTIAEMRREVRQSLKQQTRLAALGAAVSRVNHDLRNMLSTAVLLSDTLGQSADPEVKRTAPRLIDSLERATRLCTNVLRFARDQSHAIQITRFSLQNLAEEIGAATLPPTGHAVRYEVEVPRDLFVAADRDQLFRAVQNLVRNAFEAMRDSGKGDRLLVRGEAQPGQVVIEVMDNGPGVSEGTLQWLFHAFRASGKLGGTGLGLAIVREIVRAHGGEIVLASTGTEGTTFRLTIPQSEAISGDGDQRRQ